MKLFSSILVLFIFSSNALAQENWLWQDPIDFSTVDLGNKYLGITNVAALLITEILSKKIRQ